MHRLLELERELQGLKKSKSRAKRQRNAGTGRRNSAHPTSLPPSSSFSAGANKIDYEVPGLVPVFKQKYVDACWAASATMMYSWRDGVSYNVEELMDRIGKKYGDLYRNNKALAASVENDFIRDAGFESVRGFTPMLETWVQMLEDHGPLSVVMRRTAAGSAVHTIVLKAIKGDGSPSGTQATYIDPGDGKEHKTSFLKFQDLYDNAADYPIQVIHWPLGTKSIQQSLLYPRALDSRFSGVFKPSEIDRMKDFLIDNATNPDSRCNCIDTLNRALQALLDDSNLPAGTSVQATMAGLKNVGLASEPEVIEFRSAAGKITKGVVRPDKLNNSIYDKLNAMSGSDGDWSVFGMSIMDGYHSVLISFDKRSPGNFKAYWSDQWPSKGGWKHYTKADLDQEVESLTKQWWDKVLREKNKKYRTRLTLWRILKRVKD